MSTPLTSNDIRAKYIAYFQKHAHAHIEAANLLPQGDSSLLFVNSGMFPLVPYLLGEPHPMGNRLVNYQRCFRTDDIDEVGDNRHTTCFEMLGNWSLGDYFKEEQLTMRYGFLFDEIGLDPSKIYQSVFGGNDAVPEDLESIAILQKLFTDRGVSAELGPKTTGKGEDGPGIACDFDKQRIFQYTDKNRWQRGNVVGEVGGPDTETFYDTGKAHDTRFGEHCHPNCDCGRFIEIGNSVFMQYRLHEDGWKKLDRVNVDFGGGLERITMAAQGLHNVFYTDVFKDYIHILETRYNVSYADNMKHIEVIVDHARAMMFLAMDGVMISNKDQGYFLRRLVRRVLTKLHVLDIPVQALRDILDAIVEKLGATYPQMTEKKHDIIAAFHKEHAAFSKNLGKGMQHFEKLVAKAGATGLTADDAFLLQTSYGFPIDLIKELSDEKQIPVDVAGYHALVEEHKAISRQGADKKFKSGLGDNAERTVEYHTLTHILHQVLRDVLGDEVAQKGSNNTQERLRFDFSYTPTIEKEALTHIEEEINTRIRTGFTITSEHMKLADAFACGAIGLFGERYPDEVSVYTFTNPTGVVISKEICAGPHVADPSKLPQARFSEYSSIGGNTKRVKMVFVA